MNFILKNRALAYLKKKNINKIFINPDVNVKASCCSVATYDFDISTKDDDTSRYKMEEVSGISIYYNPTIKLYFKGKEDQEIIISAMGIGNFKKLYVTNEINSIEQW
ncbi:hypothetical protein ACQRC6_01890 [Peptoniphilus sp. SGI.035]|uniref:hypothetical protein n=1 Tax=Peptoniphilus sp. SGI.035 TaxID=3420564 RepID=UPI003CFCC916